MMAGHKAAYDCIKVFSETDFNEDPKKVDAPTLILHGDDDQIVPHRRIGNAVGKNRERRVAEDLLSIPSRRVCKQAGKRSFRTVR